MTQDKIGRYVVERELGRGAMGIVYLARDLYTTRWVAVKLMNKELAADAEFIKRFVQEAQAIATLEHAYIVPVYDFGAHGIQPYLVMRFMSAGALLKAGRGLPSRRARKRWMSDEFENKLKALDPRS